ncbi:hypothetical protein [Parapedobacter tibetensis]|uniref:hypothetical protein n=1 Tax=Parapedobacter tibetensis TaxID=2972951 RepID=UPI00214DE9B8|nr:hypothetical protein [Parapedobacter tibetensis]
MEATYTNTRYGKGSTYQFLTNAEVFVMADRALESLLVKHDDSWQANQPNY